MSCVCVRACPGDLLVCSIAVGVGEQEASSLSSMLAAAASLAPVAKTITSTDWINTHCQQSNPSTDAASRRWARLIRGAATIAATSRRRRCGRWSAAGAAARVRRPPSWRAVRCISAATQALGGLGGTLGGCCWRGTGPRRPRGHAFGSPPPLLLLSVPSRQGSSSSREQLALEHHGAFGRTVIRRGRGRTSLEGQQPLFGRARGRLVSLGFARPPTAHPSLLPCRPMQQAAAAWCAPSSATACIQPCRYDGAATV